MRPLGDLLAGEETYGGFELAQHPVESGDGVLDVLLRRLVRQRKAHCAVGVLGAEAHGQEHVGRLG